MRLLQNARNAVISVLISRSSHPPRYATHGERHTEQLVSSGHKEVSGEARVMAMTTARDTVSSNNGVRSWWPVSDGSVALYRGNEMFELAQAPDVHLNRIVAALGRGET
jgi:hypothetical protein